MTRAEVLAAVQRIAAYVRETRLFRGYEGDPDDVIDTPDGGPDNSLLFSDLIALADSAGALAKHDAEVRAGVLREAADEMWRVFLRLPRTPSPIGDYVQRQVLAWRAEADRIAGDQP